MSPAPLPSDPTLIPPEITLQGEELDAVIDAAADPLLYQGAVDERDLLDIVRPLIAVESVSVDDEAAELAKIVDAAIRPLAGQLSEIGYEVQLICDDCGINPSVYTAPQPQALPPGSGVWSPATTSAAEGAAVILPDPDPNTGAWVDCPPLTANWVGPDGRPIESLYCWAGAWYWVGQGPTAADDGTPIFPVFLSGGWQPACTANGGMGSKPCRGIVLYGCIPLPTDTVPVEGGSKPPVTPTPAPVPQPTQVAKPTAVASPTAATVEPEPLPDVPAVLDLWRPCDTDFKRRIDEIIRVLDVIGAEVVKWVAEGIDNAADVVKGGRDLAAGFGRLWNAIAESLPNLNPLAEKGAFGALKDPQILTTIERSAAAVELFMRRVSDFYLQPQIVSYVGHKQALLGVWTLRGLFQAYQDSSFGWEFGPQALLNLRIVYTQIDTILDHVVWVMWPVKIPELPDVAGMYLADEMTPDHLRLFTELHGYDWECFKRTLHARRSLPTPDQVLQLLLRGDIDREQYHAALRQQGWLDRRDRDDFERVGTFIPPPSDAIRFAIRDVFDPFKLGRDEMKEELKQQKGLLEALAAVGIKPIKIKPEGYQEIDYDVPLAYWLASFEEVSPTQVYQGFQRLRPGRVGRYRFVVTDAELDSNPAIKAGSTVENGPRPGTKWVTPKPITLDVVNRLLKEKDYNPIWRSMLTAIAYRVTGRIDTKRFYRLGAFGEPQFKAGFAGKPGDGLRAVGPAERELYEAFQDQGYSPDDAIVHAYAVAVEVAQSAELARVKGERAIVCAAFTEGSISYQKAVETLVATGVPVEQAESQMKLCVAKGKLTTVRKAKGSIRKGFLRGQYDANKARELLGQVGVQQSVIDESIRQWALERDATPREAKAAEMCGWVGSGLMTPAQMTTRLLNLNYRPEDVGRIIRHCELGHLAKAGKERERVLAAQLRDREKAERLASSRREKAETNRRRSLREFLALSTEKNLRDWLNRCLITPDDVRAVFAAKGANPDDVERLLVAWSDGGQCDDGDSGTNDSRVDRGRVDPVV